MKLDVRYLGGGEPGGELVGRLYERRNGRVFFEYAPEWVAGRRELSPFYLPNETRGSVATPTPGFGSLHGLFSDSLPDWWGEQLMRRYFSDRGIPWRRVTTLQQLGCQGHFGMGALGYDPDLSEGIFRDILTVEVGDLVRGAMELAGGTAEEVVPGLLRAGLSPGGAQPKVLLGLSADFSEAVAGGGALPPGFTPWLLKFDLDPELELGREEYAYALMARAAGIDLPECRLVPSAGGRAHFAVRRFDLVDGRRVHMHSYSGLTHTPVRETIDYGDLMNVTRVLTGREPEVEQVFRRAVFNVAAGNDDDHGRNHAFLMDDAGRWRLSPAYDLTRTGHPLLGRVRAAAVLGRGVEISRDDLLRLGDSQGVRKAEETVAEVVDAIRDWERWADEAGLGAYRTRAVREDLPVNGW